MTGTGESLADAHIHMNTHMEAGGATLVFTVLWYYPILVTWPRASSSLREGGGIDTPLRGWGETREREPNPAQASSFFLSFFSFFFQTLRLSIPLQTCHTQTNTPAWDQEVMDFSVCAQFHGCTLQYVQHSPGGTAKLRLWRIALLT